MAKKLVAHSASLTCTEHHDPGPTPRWTRRSSRRTTLPTTCAATSGSWNWSQKSVQTQKPINKILPTNSPILAIFEVNSYNTRTCIRLTWMTTKRIQCWARLPRLFSQLEVFKELTNFALEQVKTSAFFLHDSIALWTASSLALCSVLFLNHLSLLALGKYQNCSAAIHLDKNWEECQLSKNPVATVSKSHFCKPTLSLSLSLSYHSENGLWIDKNLFNCDSIFKWFLEVFNLQLRYWKMSGNSGLMTVVNQYKWFYFQESFSRGEPTERHHFLWIFKSPFSFFPTFIQRFNL
jgi:hypothetical protein